VKNFELKFALKFSGILKFEHFYIKFMERKVAAFKELLDIMDQLRDKCPWDREQTLESLRKLTIEETYELTDAILQNDLNGIKKELGDLMLHIVFYAKIGSEKGAFDMGDVLEGINKKLIYRHPHVFGDVNVDGSARKGGGKLGSFKAEGKRWQQACTWKVFRLPCLHW
jgi:uncharacterized protein YabN with tetrapyrrole methylase and pyrophosphatase domain